MSLFADAEVAMLVQKATRYGKRMAAHALSRESVQCVRHDIEMVSHASFAVPRALDMLEATRTGISSHPGIGWLIRTTDNAAEYGIIEAAATRLGYKRGYCVGLAARNARARDPHPPGRRLWLCVDAARHQRQRPAVLCRLHWHEAQGGLASPAVRRILPCSPLLPAPCFALPVDYAPAYRSLLLAYGSRSPAARMAVEEALGQSRRAVVRLAAGSALSRRVQTSCTSSKVS